MAMSAEHMPTSATVTSPYTCIVEMDTPTPSQTTIKRYNETMQPEHGTSAAKRTETRPS